MATVLTCCDDNGRILAAIPVRAKPRQSEIDAEREVHAKLKLAFPGRRIFYTRDGGAVPSAPPTTSRMTTTDLYPPTVEWKRKK